MIKLEELKNMAAALTEIRSSEQINEQYLEDFLLENFTEDEIESIADLDEYDMQSFVETIGKDLDADELSAFLEEAVIEHQQLDELIGAAARLIGKGIKKAARRMTTAGRADAAERKVNKIKTQQKNKDRLQKAKSELQRLKKTRREEMDPVGKEDDDIDNDGDVDSSDKYLMNRRKAITKAVKKEEVELDEASIEKLTRDRNTVSGPLADRRKEALRAKIKAARDAEEKKIKKSLGIKEAELDENISKMDDRDLDAMINKLKRQRNRTQNPDSKDKIRADIKRYEDEQKRRISNKLEEKRIVMQGSPEHLKKLIAMLRKAKPGSIDASQIKDAIEQMFGADKIPSDLKEKAESEAQAIAARIALKHKREGTKPEPGTASAEMMKMSEKDLKDFTKMKKGAPYKVNEDITKMSHGRLKWHMNTGVPHGSYTNDEMKKERDRRLKNRDSADAYKKAKAGLSENFMEATDAEIRAKQTAGATKPEGIADKESEGSKKFMMMHTTQVPDEVNADEINRMNAEEIKASLQRKVSYRWNDQKIGDK